MRDSPTMKNAYFVAVIAGLAAAALQAAMLVPSFIGIVLFSLAGLPLFVTGFAFGPPAAALAGLVGTAALTGLADWQTGLTFLATAGIAPIALTWLALKHRPAEAGTASEGEVTAAGVQWYPEGRLVLWAAGLVVVLMLASFAVGGGDLDALRTAIAGMARHIGELLTGNDPARSAEVDAFVAVLVVLLPPAATVVWHMTIMACLWLAAGIVTVSSLSLRPWAPFAALRFPSASLWGLGGAGLVMLVAGRLGSDGGLADFISFVAALALGAMASAFALLGMAVVHGLTRDLAGRGLMIAALYMALVLLQGLLIAPLVALAVADMLFDLRTRVGRQAPPPATT
jgi:hypothetical protein